MTDKIVQEGQLLRDAFGGAFFVSPTGEGGRLFSQLDRFWRAMAMRSSNSISVAASGICRTPVGGEHIWAADMSFWGGSLA